MTDNQLKLMTQDELIDLMLCVGKLRQLLFFLAGLSVGIFSTLTLILVFASIYG